MNISAMAQQIREGNPEASGNDLEVVAEYLRDNPEDSAVLDAVDADKIKQLAALQITQGQEPQQESPAPTDASGIEDKMSQPAPRTMRENVDQVARGAMSLFYPTLLEDVEARGGKQAEFSDVPTAIGETAITGLGGLVKGIGGPVRRFLAESALSGGLSQGVEAMNQRNPYAGIVGLLTPGAGRLLEKGAGLLSSQTAQGFARDVAGGAGRASTMNPENIIKWGIAPEAERDFIRSQAGNEFSLGQELVDLVNNPPTDAEAEAVEGILPALGNMDLRKPIAALRAKRLPPTTLGAEKTNALIDRQIDLIKQFGQNRAKKANEKIMQRRGSHPLDNWWEMPAEDYRALRQDIDSQIDDWGEGVSKDALEDALISARTAMKNELVGAAEGSFPEYSSAMARWHDKLDATDKVKRLLGRNPETQAKNAQGFVGRVTGENKQFQQNTLQNLDDIFGTDFLRRADAAQVAQDLGVGRRPTVGLSGGVEEIMQNDPRFWSRNEGHEIKAGDILRLQSPRLAAGTVGLTSSYLRTPIPAVADALKYELPAGLGSPARVLGSQMFRGGGLEAGNVVEGRYDTMPYEPPQMDATFVRAPSKVPARASIQDRLTAAEQSFNSLVASLAQRNPLQQQGGYFD